MTSLEPQPAPKDPVELGNLNEQFVATHSQVFNQSRKRSRYRFSNRVLLIAQIMCIVSIPFEVLWGAPWGTRYFGRLSDAHLGKSVFWTRTFFLLGLGAFLVAVLLTVTWNLALFYVFGRAKRPPRE